MKKLLLDFLICPNCLPEEHPLLSSIDESDGNDIISGYLSCKKCGRRYPIDNGIAVLLPETEPEISRSQALYEETSAVSSYLWSHYADILHEPEANHAYTTWAGHLASGNFLGLDVGCAVGRLTFELSKKNNFAIGLDRSFSFIQLARKLLIERKLDFSLINEGRLSEQKTIIFDNRWRFDKIEFIVGDALAIPFAQNSFSLLTSLNVLDKVSKPLEHLFEINRIAKNKNTRFLFSDPFSWSLDSARQADWLGGKTNGKYSGKGIDNVRLLLQGKDKIILPPWNIEHQGSVWWKIRNHRNHYEMIRSEFLVSSR